MSVPFLVEGYAEPHLGLPGGVENVVASSGTALTEEQIHLIARYAKSVTLVYDADSAGSKATIRGVRPDHRKRPWTSVWRRFPEGEDPDSFVKKNGGEAFNRRLAAAVSFLDFKASTFRDQGLLATPEGKTRAVRSIVETIARMKDEIKRNFYIKNVAEKYGVYESVLFRELETILGRERSRTAYQGRTPVPPPPVTGGLPLSALPRRADPPGTGPPESDAGRGPANDHVLSRHTSPGGIRGSSRPATAELIVEYAGAGAAWDVPRSPGYRGGSLVAKVHCRYRVQQIRGQQGLVGP